MIDIARATGLTVGTVSRALNTTGKYSITPETTQRVIEAATKLGYKPNLIGRALAAGSSGLVLLLSPNPFSPYYAEIGRQLSLQASKHRYSLLNGGNSEATASEISTDDWLYGVDGIIFCDYDRRQERYFAEATRLKIPVVGVGVRLLPHGDTVSIDLYEATCDLIRHLVDQGCRNIGMLADEGVGGEDMRASAYLDTIREAGLEPNIVVAHGQDRAAGRRAVLDHRTPFDGLFCENDELAVGASRGLLDLGLRIPQDVALAGCDGIDETLYHAAPITTLVQPVEQICAHAWNMLQARLSGSADPAQRENLKAILQVRASSTRRA